MTNEELDQARVAEANRVTGPQALTLTIARLAREGWMPPEDPDLILARGVVAGFWPNYASGYLSGNYDTDPILQAVLAGIKLGREQADTRPIPVRWKP